MRDITDLIEIGAWNITFYAFTGFIVMGALLLAPFVLPFAAIGYLFDRLYRWWSREN